ncbi:DUF6551 family protein [Shinella pollutisoli]|uniref:DUF6551 family protein n=1 Tax=Shinella pollutisoli TaxID=2250594 RepID=A0ABV7DAA9_9HYPH|nr:DUF6551 family protein [Shinella pollutisoli]
MSEAVSADLGERSELMWVDVERIFVDRNYQRELRPTRVAQILREFRWSKFEPVVLAEQEGGTFSVIDGQHRVAAGRAHPAVSQIPAAVVRLSGSREEAGAFLDINVNRTAVTTVERFWAGIEAGDEAMLRVQAVLARAGCEVIQAAGVRPASTKTNAVTAVARSIRIYGDAATSDACRALSTAWPADTGALGGIYIQALARLFRNNRSTINAERIVQKLRGSDRKMLAAQAETLRKIGGGDAALNLSKALCEIYNRQLQVNHITIGVKA